ncbi:MAG TPA: RNA pseudouridine synthase [Clostridia bacterium]|nr:RNA pseudouridine synthase [Clostridia bacterium]
MLNVLYEDNHLLVVEKPTNLPAQADASGDADLLTLAKAYIKDKYLKPGEVYLGLVHRLDRPVGGVMVFARTSKAASRLSEQFAARGAKKRYAALVTGSPKARERLAGHIVRDEASGNARMAGPDDPGAKSALLEYRRCTERSGLTLLDVSLMTGRHHQIRCQLAAAGFPIWGDQRYNREAKPGQQLALWAYSLSFDHPVKKERMEFVIRPKGGAWEPFSDELSALAAGARLVYLDGDVLCADKDAGLSVAEADGGDSLEARLKKALGDSVYPVHRLDVATGGLVLFARNERAKDALGEAIKAHLIRKYYRCEVHGRPERDEAELSAWLVKDAENARVAIYDEERPDAKRIVTRYRVLARRAETALVEVELVTGRTHQIRAHLAHAGYPLVGDDRYGDRERDRLVAAKGLALLAARLELHFPEGSDLARLEGRVISIEE